MKYFLLVISVFFISNFYAQEEGNTYALIIGISDYIRTTKLPNVKNDTDTISVILHDKYKMVVERISDKRATRYNIIQAITALSKRINENDDFFIYYSGHADYKDNKGYLLPIDVERFGENLDITHAISYRELFDLLNSVKAKNILFMADACYSGSLFEERMGVDDFRIKDRLSNNSRYAITSGRLTKANDASFYKNGHSPFANTFINILKENNKRYLSSEEIGIKLQNIIPLISSKVKNKDNVKEYQRPQRGRIIGSNDASGLFTFHYKEGYNNADDYTSYQVKKWENTKKRKLVMGVVNAVDSLKYVRVYTPFVKYIASELKMEAYELKVLDYSKIAAIVESNEIDIAVFSPFSYIEAKKEFPELELFAIPVTHKAEGYHSVIVTRKNEGYNNLEDLKGKKFAFTHTLSTSGYQIPHKVFYKRNIIPEDEMEVSISGGHRKSVISLMKGEVDAIATYRECFREVNNSTDYNIDINDYNVIVETPLIPNNAYVLSPKLDKNTQEKIKKIMYKAHKNEVKTFKMFNNELGIQKWVKRNDSFYNDLRAILGQTKIKDKFSFKLLPSENVQKMFPKDKVDLIQNIFNDIYYRLENSNRFYNENEDESYNTIKHLSLRIATFKNKFVYEVYLMNKLIHKGYLEEDLLLTKLPEIFVRQVFQELSIKTLLIFDSKNDYWCVNYGTNDGVNLNQYEFEVHTAGNDRFILNKDNFQKNSLKEDLIVFPMDIRYDKDSEVVIRYKE